MTNRQENKNRLKPIDYIAAAFTSIAGANAAFTGAAFTGAGAVAADALTGAISLTVAAVAATVAASGKRAGLVTSLALTGAFLGSYLVNKNTEISNQKNISALERRVESRTPTNIVHSLVDGRDYVTVFNKDGSRSLYQRTTNSAGTTSLTPLSQVYSNELAVLRNEQRGAPNRGESALVEKYFYLTNLLQNPKMQH